MKIDDFFNELIDENEELKNSIALHIPGNDPVDLINSPINFHSDYTVFLKDDGIVIRCTCTERN